MRVVRMRGRASSQCPAKFGLNAIGIARATGARAMLIPILLPPFLARIMRLVMAPLVVLMGVLMASVGYYAYDVQNTLGASGVPVRATVVSAHDGSDGQTYLRLHYDVDGKPYERDEAGLDPALYDQSGEIDVLYDPAAPEVHRIIGTERSAASFLGQIVGGVALALVGIVMFLWALGARITRA